MFEVNIGARPLSPFVELVGARRVEAITRAAEDVRALLGPVAVWNINSTAKGGGVAEMLRSLLRYARGLDIDVRWAVLEGSPDFFRLTKRIHNALHDHPGDGSPLGPLQHELYQAVMHENEIELARRVRPNDVVICHDPQTAGLVPILMRMGARVVWRCHIGYDVPGPQVDAGWAFLRPYLEHVPLAVFSRAQYVPSFLPRTRAFVLPPTIDPFSVKNQWLARCDVLAILATANLIAPSEEMGVPVIVREDGSVAHVERKATVVRTGDPPNANVPLVVQVSRWDRMKDPMGVMEAFALLCERQKCDAELVLAGPAVRGVADDPEAPEVLRELERAWRELPMKVKKRVHLAQLPMEDNDENAVIVNALQRHASVIVQKSIREGFGLTVTEGMWKQKPVVASAIGGIPDQLRDGIDGFLILDPTSRAELASALARVLDDPALAARLGTSAYERVREHYTGISSLERWATLFRSFVAVEAHAAM